MANRYDHRVRNIIVKTRNPKLFPELMIPASTVRDWLLKGPANVVTIPEFEKGTDELVEEIQCLKRRLDIAESKADLIITVISVLGFQLQFKRVPTAEMKSAVNNAAESLGVNACLDLIKLSKARFSAWLSRQKQCQLEDRSTCGRLSPTRLLRHEVSKIKELVIDPAFRHFSITSLAIYASRKNIVQASLSTWNRIISQASLLRPGHRYYPPKPRTGIRASAPGQIWHLDQTIIKLKCGARCFIQAVIDNFSRYVLAWQISENYGELSTKSLLLKAIEQAQRFGLTETPNVMVDGGTENFNKDVDQLVEDQIISRTLAQIEIDFSNSLIESLFLRLKNNHLYFKQLTTFDKLVEHTNFYLQESNEVIPMAALNGATPLEAISGYQQQEVIEAMKSQSKLAREQRIHANQSLLCDIC